MWLVVSKDGVVVILRMQLVKMPLISASMDLLRASGVCTRRQLSCRMLHVVGCAQGCRCRNPPKATGEDAFDFCQHGFAEGFRRAGNSSSLSELVNVMLWPRSTMLHVGGCAQGCRCRNPPKATGEDAFDFCQHGFAEGFRRARNSSSLSELVNVMLWPRSTMLHVGGCAQGCRCRNPPKATGEDAFDFCQHGFAEGFRRAGNSRLLSKVLNVMLWAT